MSKTFVRIYAFFAVMILLGTIGVFAYRLYNNSKAELINAEKDFKFIAKFISTPPEGIKKLSQEHITAIKNMFEKSENIENAILTNQEEILFSWAKGANKLIYNEHNDIILTGNSFITKPYSMQIIIQEDDLGNTLKLNFCAGLNKVSNSLIYSYSRDSFLILTGLLLLTLALVVINAFLNTTPKVYANVNPQNTHTNTITTESYTFGENLDNVNWDDLDDLNIADDYYTSTESDFSENDTGTFDETLNENNEEFDEEFNSNFIDEPTNAFNDESDKFNSQKNTFDTPLSDENLTDEPQKNTEQNCKSLFSNDTGLCTQNYLIERLEAELGRAAASEQNLGLIMIKVKNIQHKDTEAKKIANYLISEFQFKDMLFEFADNSFVAIMHGANLEESMKTAQRLYTNIKDILEIYAFSNKFAIGITTRSARLVPANRLIDEVISAVNRAFEYNDEPIVAFRPDPDLYRKFIADYT
ncbi:MAG: hypothetical protein CR988_03970 [Treponema sp.]|nr:MAG: hypothetical protein CR988_03970 [Treponema sp.]